MDRVQFEASPITYMCLTRPGIGYTGFVLLHLPYSIAFALAILVGDPLPQFQGRSDLAEVVAERMDSAAGRRQRDRQIRSHLGRAPAGLAHPPLYRFRYDSGGTFWLGRAEMSCFHDRS